MEAFLEGCRDDAERQLAMVVAFTSVTNQGLPVMPTFWRVVKLLSPPALQGYVAWLRDMFLQPDLDALVDFSTNNQKKTQDASLHGCVGQRGGPGPSLPPAGQRFPGRAGKKPSPRSQRRPRGPRACAHAGDEGVGVLGWLSRLRDRAGAQRVAVPKLLCGPALPTGLSELCSGSGSGSSSAWSASWTACTPRRRRP